MSVQTLERPSVATPPTPAYCSGESCGKPMLYRRQQTPGDGTVRRASRDQCHQCYRQAHPPLNPTQPGWPPFQRRSQAHLEDIRQLLATGLNAEQIAQDLGHSNPRSTYRFLERHGESELLRRLRATMS